MVVDEEPAGVGGLAEAEEPAGAEELVAVLVVQRVGLLVVPLVDQRAKTSKPVEVRRAKWVWSM